MCGIAGMVSSRQPPLQAHVEAMTLALQHRGPDADGFWSDGICALGHRRLAIIDLSEAGRQPLSNEDGSVWITFNGEIYNFHMLRRELEGLGHTLRTATDTETIVHAYEQWGTACVQRLRGMFAFAIWDQRCRQLFLARDRIGKKPIFYTQVGDSFRFASELQGLLADAAVPRQVHLPAIDTYLSLGYVPAPLTAFEGIFKLPPAHWLTVDLSLDTPVTKLERYWSLDYQPKVKLSLQEAGEGLREKLVEAVRLRMISDVPLGAFLSGGIDSSIVVGLMAELSDRPVRTFSIGFEDASFNELPHARRVAERWGADHHEQVVKPDALAILPSLVRHYGEPYADSSAIPTFYVSQMTREHVTVALNGDGGDESFAGYERYLGNRLAERLQRLPGGKWPIGALRRVVPDSIHPKSRLRTLNRFLAAADLPMGMRYTQLMSALDVRVKQNLYQTQMAAQLRRLGTSQFVDDLFDRTAHLDPVEAAMAVDVQSYLPYDLLVKVDITSMANSLEARSPLLDHEVMEFAAALPVGHKVRGANAKYVLKHAFADLLPRENVKRRKMGFGVPVGTWMRGALRPLLEDALRPTQVVQRGYFKPESVNRLLTEHMACRADHTAALWSLLMLELWHREFPDQ